MNSFTSFKNSSNPITYFFNKNHFVLLLLSLVIIIFFSMYFSRQKVKTQKIAVFIVALLLIIIEGLRIFWRYKYLEYNGEDLNFFDVTNLDFFTISLWISIPFILIGCFLRKKDKHNIFALNFVFSVASLFAIITLIYPLNINTNFEFYHCYNLMYMLTRSFIIMLALLFVFAKWISVENFLDLWKAIFSLLTLFVVCYLVVYLLKTSTNVFYLSYFPTFEDLGIHLTAPWHIIAMSAFLFMFQIALHFPFFVHKWHKLRHGGY